MHPSTGFDNIFIVLNLMFIVPFESVGLLLLIIGLSIITFDRVRNYNQLRAQRIITLLFSVISIVSLFLLIVKIHDELYPWLNLSTDFHKISIPATGFMNNPFPINNFLPNRLINENIQLALWFIVFVFFPIFYFYILWQKNVKTIGRFFVMSGYLFLLISFVLNISYGLLNIVINFLGIKLQ